MDDFLFSIVEVHFFVNSISLCVFHLLYTTNMLCLLRYCINLVFALSSHVSSQDFYCSLPRDQSRDVTPCLGVCVILQCISFHVHTSSSRRLLLRLCSNRCAEAIMAYRNSLLIVFLMKGLEVSTQFLLYHGGKFLIIIIYPDLVPP